MLTGNRVIWEDNVTLRDISRNVNDVFSTATVLPLVAAEDYLYIGSEMPFNHRYFQVQSANDQVSSVSVSLWTGSSWVAALDVIDDTASATGATLSRAGIIQWTKNKNTSWTRESESANVTGLSGTNVYDMFWARLTFSGDLKATTSLRYVGHRFANDSQLGGLYPDLVRTSVITAFQTGKTNWNEQHVLAAEEIIADLRSKQQIWSGSQVFDWQKLTTAAIHKVAEVIMRSFGDDFVQRRVEARTDYDDALNKSLVGFDRNGDGNLDRSEQMISVGLVRR